MMIKIWYPPSKKTGNREYRLLKQGLENNPRVKLVDDTGSCDFVFLYYGVLEGRSYSRRVFPPEKTVFIDYHDKPRWTLPIDCLAYFKRSWVKMGVENYTVIKVPMRRPANFHPIHFAVMDEFISDEKPSRDIALTCTLRAHGRHMNRLRVLEALNDMDIDGPKHIGELNRGSMRSFDDQDMRDYFGLMRRSKIVVTCNPNPWEGDHRTWEALASGALVFVDRMFTPLPHPFIDGKHWIEYDISLNGLEELRDKILYYIYNHEKAAEIARAGYEHALKYHRSTNRIDDILEKIT